MPSDGASVERGVCRYPTRLPQLLARRTVLLGPAPDSLRTERFLPLALELQLQPGVWLRNDPLAEPVGNLPGGFQPSPHPRKHVELREACVLEFAVPHGGGVGGGKERLCASPHAAPRLKNSP